MEGEEEGHRQDCKWIESLHALAEKSENVEKVEGEEGDHQLRPEQDEFLFLEKMEVEEIVLPNYRQGRGLNYDT